MLIQCKQFQCKELQELQTEARRIERIQRENQPSEGDSKGNIQENHRGDLWMLYESDEKDPKSENSLFLRMIKLDVNTIENWTTTLQEADTLVARDSFG